MTSVDTLTLSAANLITQMDYLTRLLLTIKQLGLIPVMPVRLQVLCEEIQTLFMLSEAWKKTGIRRQDILDATPKAKKIEKQRGTLPDEILYQKATLPFLFLEAS